MRRCLIALVFALLVVAACAPVKPGPSGVNGSGYELAVAGHINNHRQANGRAALGWNNGRADGAQAWADYMAQTGDYSHSCGIPNRPACAYWEVIEVNNTGFVSWSGYPLDPGCEASDRNASVVVQEWINSPSHNAALLANVRDQGGGVACAWRNGVLVEYEVWRFSP